MIETGINFGNIHSYYDLGLILSKVDIPPASPKTNYIDIPGADGSADLSDVHGEIKFNDRDCTFTFTAPALSVTDWEELKRIVSNALNGKVFKITLDKDPDYYFKGRCTVKSQPESGKLRQIVVTARVSPYKLKQDETILKYQLSGTEQTIIIQNLRKSVSPYIETSDDNVMVRFGLNTFTLETAGQYKILDILLVEGDNTLTVSGTGTITFSFQEGAL